MKPFCVSELSVEEMNRTPVQDLIDEKLCPQFILESEEKLKRCIPKPQAENINTDVISKDTLDKGKSKFYFRKKSYFWESSEIWEEFYFNHKIISGQDVKTEIISKDRFPMGKFFLNSIWLLHNCCIIARIFNWPTLTQ